jgi:hypothetical protein
MQAQEVKRNGTDNPDGPCSVKDESDAEHIKYTPPRIGAMRKPELIMELKMPIMKPIPCCIPL